MPLSKMDWREASILKAISNPNIKSFFQAALAKTVFDRKKTHPHYSTFIDVKAKPFPKLHKRIHTTFEIIFECSCYIFQDTQNWRIQHWEELTNISLLCHDARTDMNVEVKTSGSSSLVSFYPTRREETAHEWTFPFPYKISHLSYFFSTQVPI